MRLLGLALSLWRDLQRLGLLMHRARKQGEQGGRAERGKQLDADALEPIARRCNQLLGLVIDGIAEKADKARHVGDVAFDRRRGRFNVFGVQLGAPQGLCAKQR